MSIKSFTDKDYIKIGKKILDISKSIKEPFNISLVVDNKDFMIVNIELIKAQKVMQRLYYDNYEDFQEEPPLDPCQRGIM